MTVIAWDGQCLAADKRTNFGGLHATTTKVSRLLDGSLIAGCGPTALIIEMTLWIGNGADPATLPAAQRDEKDCASMLVIRPSGVIHQYETTPHPITIQNKFWSIGSGRDYAMAAMFLGKSAVDAVGVASALDSTCGNGVDWLFLNQPLPANHWVLE